VQPILNKSAFGRLKITLPPLFEQQAIAEILGALDDKIELNRKMNATLDELARTIFRLWFVDFAPVRTKAEGGEPFGMDAETAALFPDRFTDSEFGSIPEGWEIKTLGDTYSLGIGGQWGSDEATASDSVAVTCLRGIDLANLSNRLLPDAPVRWVTEKQFARRSLQGNEILIEGSGSFCGRSLLLDERHRALFEQPLMYTNFCKRLDQKVAPAQAVVVWLQLQDAYVNGRLDGYRTGSAFPNFDVKALLGSFEVVVPNTAVCNAFDSLWNAFLRLDLVKESRTLANLRDTLLPELISGRIRVPEAERAVAEVL
jgi:type I restriction enzyme, S subunit